MNTRTPIVKPVQADNWRSNWREDFDPGYPLTFQEHTRVLNLQNHRCSICGYKAKYPEEKLVLDHDHDTLLIRGYLCGKCNIWLKQAENYLANPPTKRLGISKKYTCKRSGKTA